MMIVGCWSIRHTSETTVQHTLLTTYHEHSAVFGIIQPCKLSLYVSCSSLQSTFGAHLQSVRIYCSLDVMLPALQCVVLFWWLGLIGTRVLFCVCSACQSNNSYVSIQWDHLLYQVMCNTGSTLSKCNVDFVCWHSVYSQLSIFQTECMLNSVSCWQTVYTQYAWDCMSQLPGTPKRLTISVFERDLQSCLRHQCLDWSLQQYKTQAPKQSRSWLLNRCQGLLWSPFCLQHQHTGSRQPKTRHDKALIWYQ